MFLLPLLGLAQQQAQPDFYPEINRRITSAINHGIAIATIDTLNNARYYNYGYENDAGTKTTEHSIFEVASISKTFTSTLAIRLADEQAVELQQEIRNYIPDSLPESVKRITFQELINHTSGLPRLPLNFWASNWDNPYSDYTNAKLLADLMQVQIDSTKQWSYSNLGYMLLGYILERSNDFISLQQLFSLISLRESYTAFHDSVAFSTPHNFGSLVEHWEFPECTNYLGGVKSSSSDLLTYLSYQATHNNSFANNYASKDILINKADSIYCRNGWLLFRRNNQEIIWHNGTSGGFNSFIGYNIQTKSGIVVLSNSQSSITDIGLHYLSPSFKLMRPKKPLINELKELIEQDAIGSVENQWANCDTSVFDKSMADVYWLQCHYISKKNFEAALALNDILLKELKNDWETLYYRANICRAQGDAKSAKAHYEQANALFPENNFIIAEIESLPDKSGKQ